MDLRRLQFFVTVGEELNFHRAAHRLGVSQPAVTKQIHALEAELGLDLFVRDQHRIVGLTAGGSSYLDDARRLLSELDRAAELAREIAEGRNGRLRLGVCDDAAGDPLAGIFAAFHSRFPAVELDIFEASSATIADALRRNDLDLGLVLIPIDEPALATEPLWREPWFVALPEGHPLARAEPLTCADLATMDLILAHPELAVSGHEQVRDAFRAAGVTPRIVIRALRQATMLMLVAAGAGATFIPASLAATLKISGVVARPFVADAMTMTAAYRADNPSGLAMQFLRIAQEIAATLL
jgi:DNA-binding transcriptional LysR family regulator